MAFLNWLRNLIRPTPPKPPVPPTPTPPAPTDLLNQMLAAHNAERSKKGLRPLVLNSALVAAAQKHAVWMDTNKRMSHTGAGGSQFDERIEAEGYRLRAGGENIAAGYTTVAAVMNGWMNSSGHRANILSGNYKEVGFGKSGTYWCVDFGTQPTTDEIFMQIRGVLDKVVSLPGGIEES